MIDIIVPFYTLYVCHYLYKSCEASSKIEKNAISLPSTEEKNGVNNKKEVVKKLVVNQGFNGTYKLIKNINVQELMAAQGMGYVRRKLVDAADVIQAISIDKDEENEPKISFYVNASVRGRGEVIKRATYVVNSKHDQRMVQQETGLVFLDKVFFAEDGKLIMIRKEEKNMFQLVVSMYLESSTKNGSIMTSESKLKTKNGKVVESKRIFKKINNSGKQYFNDNNEGRENISIKTSKPNLEDQNIVSKAHTPSFTIEHQNLDTVQNNEVVHKNPSSSIFQAINMEGKYSTINPNVFFSNLSEGSSMQDCTQKSLQMLRIAKENNYLHIKSPYQLDTTIDLRGTDITSTPTTHVSIGKAVFETVAMISPNKKAEIVVKRKCLYPLLEPDGEKNDDSTDEVLNDILETYQWSDNGIHLTVKNTLCYNSGKKIQFMNAFTRI